MGIFGKSKNERIKGQLTELIKEGIEFFKRGNYSQAVIIFEKILKIDPEKKIYPEWHTASEYLWISQKHLKLKDIEKILILSDNEKVIWKGSINLKSYGYKYEIDSDFLVLTSENLYFLDYFAQSVVLVIPLENVISISDLWRSTDIKSSFYRDYYISLTMSIIREKFKTSRITFDTYGLNNEYEKAHAILLDLVQKKKNESKKRVNINVDFSSIKEYLKNGGIVMQMFKCPGCGAALEFPDNVDTTICQYCGINVKAVDVFEKIRALI